MHDKLMDNYCVRSRTEAHHGQLCMFNKLYTYPTGNNRHWRTYCLHKYVFTQRII